MSMSIIDDMTVWFGRAMRILCPELIGPMPERGMRILGKWEEEQTDLQGRDPKEFCNNPLDFLA